MRQYCVLQDMRIVTQENTESTWFYFLQGTALSRREWSN